VWPPTAAPEVSKTDSYSEIVSAAWLEPSILNIYRFFLSNSGLTCAAPFFMDDAAGMVLPTNTLETYRWVGWV
jgi:hypothetical protein